MGKGHRGEGKLEIGKSLDFGRKTEGASDNKNNIVEEIEVPEVEGDDFRPMTEKELFESIGIDMGDIL